MAKFAFLVALLLSLCACASVSHETTHINPPAIHRASDNNPALPKGIGVASEVKSAPEAEALPTLEYYAAMNAARAASNDPAAIARYVDAGVTLVNSYCLRWFQHLSEQDVKKSFNSENFNVVRALGTAFLGLGNANSLIVSAYGASNTAYESYSKNYSDAFLLAPNSRKVKAQVLSLLDTRADELLGKPTAANGGKPSVSPPETFSEAYRKLERFADLCTHSTAKEIVNSALDQSAAAAAADGKISLEPTSKALKAADASVAIAKADATNARRAAQAENQPLRDELKLTQSMLTLQATATQRAVDQAKALTADKADLQRRLEELESALAALRSQQATPK
jgi:hypothetical protein